MLSKALLNDVFAYKRMYNPICMRLRKTDDGVSITKIAQYNRSTFILSDIAEGKWPDPSCILLANLRQDGNEISYTEWEWAIEEWFAFFTEGQKINSSIAKIYQGHKRVLSVSLHYNEGILTKIEYPARGKYIVRDADAKKLCKKILIDAVCQCLDFRTLNRFVVSLRKT